MRTWLAVAAALAACGGNHSSGSGGNGGGNTGAANFTLTIDVAGQGTVVAAAQGISCASSCSQALPSGTAVHLEAQPAAGMQFAGWSGACTGTSACDLTLSADAQVGASFAAPPRETITVNLVGAGTGRVVSNPAGIDCPGACAMAVPAGTPVALAATADATSHFEGYGAGCSGLSCSFVANANTTIYANFSKLTATQHTLTLTVSGNGAVTSQPAGINCPGACSARFDDGTKVALTETAASGAAFTAWGGACTGSGACSVTLTGDASVSAQFGATTDPCAGLMPKLPAARSQTASRGDGSALACIGATSDGAGGVFIRGDYTPAGGSATRGVFAAGGEVESLPVTQTNGYGPVGLTSGFGLFTGMDPALDSPHFATFAPDGTQKSLTGAPSDFVMGVNAKGAAVTLTCTSNLSSAGTGGGDYGVLLIDDSGKTTGASLFQDGTVGCLQVFSVMVDTNGNTLIVVRSKSNILGAQWLDPSGKPLQTDWFVLGTLSAAAQPGNATLMTRPLIGGGAALRINGAWTATIPSGSSAVQAPPSFFEANKDAVIVLGGKAYAMIPDPAGAGTLDIVEPGGKTCGSLATATSSDMFLVGKDGTLIDENGPALCTAQYYPQALK